MSPTTIRKPDEPEYYYDRKKGSYWLRYAGEPFLNLEKRELLVHLRRSLVKVDCSFDLKASKQDSFDYGVTIGDNLLYNCQRFRGIDYAGPLAGHRIGLFKTQSGQSLLVTNQAKPIEPKSGPMEELEKFLGELFGPDPEQGRMVLLWLAVARRSLEEGDYRPGQILVLAGPSGCGKSLFQSLVTEFLGGRAAEPYSFMVGDTTFNSHIAGAEHLVIADQQSSLDIRSRRAFGESIKQLTVNQEISIHAKGRDISVTAPTFRRMTLSVNHEPERLAIVPPFDASIQDKVMLVKCGTAEVGANRLKTWKTLTGQLPALAWELDRMKVPAKLRSDRYGVTHYHNAELLEIVSDISPENRLQNLIEEVIFKRASGEKEEHFEARLPDGVFVGQAIELERLLRNSNFAFAAEKLLGFPGACGTYLSRLASQNPARFAARKSQGRTIWRIEK